MQPAKGFSLHEAARKVVEKWASLKDSVPRSHPELTSIVMVAANDPVLGLLFPFTSFDRLCFSRCVDSPYWVDIFIAPLGKGLFRVHKASGELSWIERDELGRGDPKTAAAIAVSALPPGYGPALPGNAESLSRSASD